MIEESYLIKSVFFLFYNNLVFMQFVASISRESFVEQSYNIKEMDAIAIGALIKSVYRESPLITGELYKKIMVSV